MKSDFKFLILRWPTVSAFARECGINENLARRYVNTGRLGARYWPQVVEAAHARGFTDITMELLAEIEVRRDAGLREHRHHLKAQPYRPAA